METLKCNKYLSCIGNPCSEIVRIATDFLIGRTSYNRLIWVSPLATKEELNEILSHNLEIDINKSNDYHNLMGVNIEAV